MSDTTQMAVIYTLEDLLKDISCILLGEVTLVLKAIEQLSSVAKAKH
jgi:hypothetical protein